IRTLRLRVQILGRGQRRCGIVRKKRRHFERNPTVYTTGAVIDRPKQISGLREILQREPEEQPLRRLALRGFASYRIIVVVAVLDRTIEDGRMGCQSRARNFVGVCAAPAPPPPAPRAVVEPEA